MQVEQIDRDAAARWAKMQSRHAQAANMKRGACDDAPLVKLMSRHRHQVRAEVVGEIVAWMKDKASYAWSRESELADQIEAKFGTPNVAD